MENNENNTKLASKSPQEFTTKIMQSVMQKGAQNSREIIKQIIPDGTPQYKVAWMGSKTSNFNELILYPIVSGMIVNFISLYTLSKTMSPHQISDLAWRLIDYPISGPEKTVEDLYIFGPPFDHLDGSIVLSWFAQYKRMRYDQWLNSTSPKVEELEKVKVRIELVKDSSVGAVVMLAKDVDGKEFVTKAKVVSKNYEDEFAVLEIISTLSKEAMEMFEQTVAKMREESKESIRETFSQKLLSRHGIKYSDLARSQKKINNENENEK